MEKMIRTCCQSSHSECGVLVHVSDGKVTKIEGDPDHPFTRGYICVKGMNQMETVNHPDRVIYPMKRAGERGCGKWQRIPWNQALDEIAAKLTEIKDRYGYESFGAEHGTGPRASTPAVSLLCHALNSPNVISVDLHICWAPTTVSECVTYGKSIAMEIGPDFLNSKCILIVGGNPVVGHGPRGRDILEACRKGGRLIVVDPRQTQLAAQADLWLQIRPGTDSALALAWINYIIQNNLFDEEFVKKYCYGFDELKKHVAPWTIEKAAEITWIPVEKIVEAVRMYAVTKPAVMYHRQALDHGLNSCQSVRGLSILLALTGNVDVKGGNLISPQIKGFLTGGHLYYNGDPRFAISSEIEKKRIGFKEYPLISGLAGPERHIEFVHSALASNAMLVGKPYPMKALWCAGGDPMLTQPNVRRFREAVRNLDLFVVNELFMTPTAELADYVLPIAHWLERDETTEHTMYMECVSSRQKVLEPRGECWDDMKITIETVKRIPWANRNIVPWDTVEQFNNCRIESLGLTLKDLQERGYLTSERFYKKYEKEGFKTPTGKVELYSTTFARYGYDALPTYKEPPESPISSPEVFKDYPYVLTTGARTIGYMHSEGRQIPSLRKLFPDPLIEIHPDIARKEGLADGDWAWIETPQMPSERVKFRIKYTASMDPRVIHAYSGWWFPEKPGAEHGVLESNINLLLTDDAPREPICGSLNTRETLCRVYPVGK